MVYKFNPKTDGSGIICAIPQTGRCPNNCEDCFFQSGRSYLEPLSENLPNIPSVEQSLNHIVRVNDGNDSNVQRDVVIEMTKQFPMKFYNTAIPKNFDKFDAPVVLTVNPGKLTDKSFHKLDEIPKNLMMVRVRTNTWNMESVVFPSVEYYTTLGVPVVLTFMAYHNEDNIPISRKLQYIHRKRTLNEYWAIRTDTWHSIMEEFWNNYLVYSCGKVEGELGKTGCRYCGNCLREYFATVERMK